MFLMGRFLEASGDGKPQFRICSTLLRVLFKLIIGKVQNDFVDSAYVYYANFKQ